MTLELQQVRAALADRYRIERELGRGGMATVYLAEVVKHRRQVALKVLKPDLADALGPERFLVGVEGTARLDHPHCASDTGGARGVGAGGAGGAVMGLWRRLPLRHGWVLRLTVSAVLVAFAGPLAPVTSAQDGARQPASGCYRARPAPDCTVFYLTNAGAFLRVGPRPDDGQAVLDWGVMVNVRPGYAVGVSWFVSAQSSTLRTGPALRARRWFTDRASLDVAVGTPVTGGFLTMPGSVLALVKYNPVHWFGFAVRPEYHRQSEFEDESPWRIHMGVDAGWYPGLAITGATVVGLGLLVLALSGISS